MNVILHLSDTDVSNDSRILKELEALTAIPDCKVRAFGVRAADGPSKAAGMKDVDIEIITLLAKRLPRRLRMLFVGAELMLRFVYRGMKARPKLVHCHDIAVLPAGVMIKALTGAKLVYDAHELESRRNGLSSFFGAAVFLCERLCWSRIDFFISVSPSILDWYQARLGSKANALVLNSPMFDPKSEPQRRGRTKGRYFHQLYGIPDDKRVFVYLGILGRGRGIHICLDVFRRPDVDAHAVFIGWGELEPKIAEYAALEPKIHHHLPVAHTEVVDLVQSADFGLCLLENVSLSDYYCLPNKLFEYVFAGLPVLASNFPELKRIIEEYELGYCCEPEAEAIADTIKKASVGPIREIDRDLSELSWATQADRLVTAYRQLLG